jgi:hypothetical protein
LELSYLAERKTNMEQIEYKGFGILKVKNGYQVYIKGELIRTCKTLKEVKHRIDTQTI